MIDQPGDELYHASENQSLEILEPRAIGKRDPNEGPVVFATDDKAYATMFLVKSDDSWTLKFGLGNSSRDCDWFICINDKDRYLNADHGGAIYTLPKNQFLTEPKPDSTPEWASKQPVTPLKKEIYPSGLEAMMENGVQVYFTTPEQFESIKAKRETRSEDLKNLESENERRGLQSTVRRYF